MSCGCYEIRLQGEQYCQGCMPDEYSWLVSVDSKPDPFLMDRNHAYITPDNTVFVLDHTRSKAVPIGGGGGGIDLSIYALNSDLEKKVRDLLAEIAKVKSEINVYEAGNNIEITPDNVINNTYTYDDRIVQERLSALENKDIPVYMAGEGITIGPDKTIDAEVTLAKVNEVVNRAVADTEINLNSANLVIEGDNLVWKGVLNTGRQLTSSVPLSSLGNQTTYIGDTDSVVANPLEHSRVMFSGYKISESGLVTRPNKTTFQLPVPKPSVVNTYAIEGYSHRDIDGTIPLWYRYVHGNNFKNLSGEKDGRPLERELKVVNGSIGLVPRDWGDSIRLLGYSETYKGFIIDSVFDMWTNKFTVRVTSQSTTSPYLYFLIPKNMQFDPATPTLTDVATIDIPTNNNVKIQKIRVASNVTHLLSLIIM